MTREWFVARDKKKCGPYPLLELKKQAREGSLQPSSMLLEQGTTHWQRADTLPDLFASPPPPVSRKSPSATKRTPPPPPSPRPRPVAAAPSSHRLVLIALLVLGGVGVLGVTGVVGAVMWWRARPSAAASARPEVPSGGGQSEALAGGLPEAAGDDGNDQEPAEVVSQPLPADYVELAQALSNSYQMERGAGEQAAPRQVADFVEIISKMEQAPTGLVRSAAGKLKEGRERADEAVARINDAVDNAQRNQDEVLADAASGKYTRQVEHTYEITRSDGTTTTRTVTETVDESGMPVFGAMMLNAWVHSSAPGTARKRVAKLLEEGRLEAWNEITPRLSEIYPNGPLGGRVVKFRITAPDPSTNKKGEFVAVNAGRHVLTNVTLELNLAHFTTFPEPTTYQVYFIPRWAPGQEVYLPAACVRNRKTEEYTRGRPTIANPDLDHPDARHVARHPWLAGLGGVAEVRWSIWSSEGQTTKRTHRFPEQAEAGATWEVTVATRLARSMLAARIRAQKLPSDAPVRLPAGMWEERAARRVLLLVPGSELARKAQLLLDDPQALFREADKEGTQGMARMTEPGSVFVGEWKFELKGFGLGVPGNVVQAASARKDTTGKVALRIMGRDENAIAATLYDPDQPGHKRELVGEVQGSSIRFLGVDGQGPAFVPEHLDLFTSPTEVILQQSQSELSGDSPGYLFPRCYGIRLSLKPGTAPLPPDDKPSDAVARLLTMTQAGKSYQGSWKLQLKPGRLAGVPSAVVANSRSRRNGSGDFVLYISAQNAEARSLKATLYDPEQPGRRKEMTGRIVEEPASERAYLYFPGFQPALGLRTENFPESYAEFYKAPGNIMLEVKGEGLAGKLPGANRFLAMCYWFDMECQPGGKAPPEGPGASDKEAEKVESLLALSRPGTSYRGTWKMHVAEFGPDVPADFQEGISKNRDSSGEFVMLILDRNVDDLSVKALIHHPTRQTRFRREVSGRIYQDKETGQTVLHFPGPQASVGARRSRFHAGWVDFFHTPGEIKLVLEDGSLTGKLTVSAYSESYWFVLEGKSANSRPR